ncbi:hypothetical protein KC660_00950, partial [Candidatus Dojkabacteria bacterium]|nr:hypothetical protein [Candidatus Dojkabacteria bacterium]
MAKRLATKSKSVASNLKSKIKNIDLTKKHFKQIVSSRKFQFTVVGFFIIIGLSILLIIANNQMAKAEAGWPQTLNSWGKRKRLKLTNNSSATLHTDSTFAVNINTKELYDGGYIQNDCDDIRIYYQPNNSTAVDLNYYFDPAAGATNCSDSQSTKFYFPLQADLSSNASSTYYYVYLSNSSATGKASVDAFDIGSKQALMVCPFNGDTECINGDGAESPTTETGAIRYSGSKSALSFKGKYISGGDANVMTFTSPGVLNQFTVEFWFNAQKSENTSWADMFGAISGTDNGAVTIGTSSGSSTLYYGIGNVNNSLRTIRAPISFGTWIHVAATYDGSTFSLFKDGVLIDTKDELNGTSPNLFGIVGRSGYAYRGMIDEFRISTVVRYTSNFTPQQTPYIRDDYTKILFHFDENGNDPRNSGKAFDDSGNGSYGYINGAKYVSGLVGVDASTSDTGNVPSQAYADHSGVFIEEGTTNLATNPSFENGTFDTGWDYETSSINTATITTSSSPNATDIPGHRKAWHDGTRYWQALNANSRIEFWYSTDGTTWTENTVARISINTYNFTVVSNSANFFVAYQSGYSIGMSHASSYPGTSFTWSSVTYPCSGSNPLNGCASFSLTQDSSGYLWMIYIKATPESVPLYYKKASNTNDETTWGTQTLLGSLSYIQDYSSIVSLGSSKLYAVWTNGPNIFGKYYNGSSWDSSPTIIGTFVSSGRNFSLTSDSNGNAHLVYGNSSDQIIYQEYTTSWQSAVTLDSNSSNETPTITIDPSSGTLYAFWINNDDILYKTASSPYTSGYWDASPTTLESNGVNNYLTSGLNTYTTGGPFLAWTEGTGSPYNVKFANLVSGNLTITENSTAPYYKFGSKSAKIVASGTGANNFTTSIDPNSTATHTLSAYVYNGTTGAVGGTVDNTVAQLVWEGSAQSGTTYTDMGGGWWRLTYSAAVTDSTNDYGIYVLDGKTVYLDGVQLEQKSYATTYTDGSLGNGYSWSGTANASTSSRTDTALEYSSTSNIDNRWGTVNFWIKKNYWDRTLQPYSAGGIMISEDSGNDFYFSVHKSVGLHFRYSAAGNYISYNSDSINQNQWQMLSVRWDGNGSVVQEYQIYLNGTQVATRTGVSESLNTISKLIVGNSAEGAMSDLKVFGQALDTTEISDLYYSGLGAHQIQEGFTDSYSGEEPPALVWHFDEGYGSTAYDSTTNHNDGTITSATWSSDESVGLPNGKSLKFDGSSSFVSRSYSSDSELNPGTDDFTLSAWFKSPSTVSSQMNIISRYNSSGYKVYMNSSGNICFGVDDDSSWGPDDVACSTNSYNNSTWHHINAVKSSTGLKLYIDGFIDGEDNSLSITGNLSGGNPTFYIGVDSNGSSNYWSGFLDEIKVFNYSRSEEQVKTDYQSSGTLKGVVTAQGKDQNRKFSQGLVGYWKMDEASWNGTTGEVKDASGNGNNGTRVGDATTASGKFGNGGTFDGTGDYIQVSDSNSVSINNSQFAVLTWIKSSSAGSVQTIVRKQSSNYVMALVSSKLWCELETGQTINTGVTLSNDTWYLVGCVFDGQNLISYVNGVEQGRRSNTSASSDSNNPLFIGSQNGTGQYLSGSLDEVRIYNRALSPAEVQGLYKWAPGPVAQWDFDEGSGTVVNDSSGNGHTGTIYNGSIANGKFGNGVELESGESVSTPDSGDLSSKSFTLNYWLKVDGSSSSWDRVGKFLNGDNTDGSTEYQVRLASSGVWCLGFNNWATIYCNNLGQSASITLGEWNFFTFSYNKSTGKLIYLQNGNRKLLDVTNTNI